MPRRFLSPKCSLWVLCVAVGELTSCGLWEAPEGRRLEGDAGVSAESTASYDLADCTSPDLAPLRRLSRVEYGNTLFQLFGNVDDQRLGVDSLVPDGEALGFSNQASVVSTSPLLAAQYLENAEHLAERQADRLLAELPSCDAGGLDAACETEVADWIRSFGRRVYRRPLEPDEVASYVESFRWELSLRGQPQEGVKRIIELLLQSPHFLYRPEFGREGEEQDGVVPLTDHEVATRLSYMFWNTMPDLALFEAADRGELGTEAEIEAQARRLLRAERSRLLVRDFHTEWLDLDDILDVRNSGKDLTLFPDYDDSVPPELFEETLEFFEYAIYEDDARVETLLTAPYSRMNRFTGQFYGLEGGPTTAQFETVTLDPEHYAGFLTQAGLLMAHANADLSSPVHRGLFVRTNLLCQPPPPPPPDVPPPPEVDRSKTTREQFAEHSENPTCAACHQLMDPIGLGFEHFDAMGRYRDEEWGQPIDATGTVYQFDEEGRWAPNIEFDGVADLGRQLAASDEVRRCVARQWFRYSMGRGEDPVVDACTLDAIDAEFARSDYDVKELLITIVRTPSFRSRSVVVPGEEL